MIRKVLLILAWLGAAVACLEGLGRETAQVQASACLLYGLTCAAGGLVLRLLFGRRLRFVLPAARTLWALSLAAFAATMLWAGREPAREPPRADAPDIVLISCDTTRGDRWEAIAAEDGFALERGAVRFHQATATASLTAPSHATLLTGLHAHAHGVFNNGGRLGAEQTLPGILRRHGYRTLAATSVIHLDPGFGFARGFDDFDRTEDGVSGLLRRLQGFHLPRLALRWLGAGRPTRSGESTFGRALHLWERAPEDAPRFLWVHIFEPHWPYEAPVGPEDGDGAPQVAAAWPDVPTPGYAKQQVTAWRKQYDAEIRAARALVADFLAAVEASASQRPLIVVFTSDHGESLGEHGVVDHGSALYEHELRVPLWVRAPGAAAGIIETPVSHVDLLPSLCELAGVPAPDGLPGRSWAAALRGEELLPVILRASTRHAGADNAMVRLGSLKLIRNLAVAPDLYARNPNRPASAMFRDAPWLQAWEAYELRADPWEQRSLAGSLPPSAAAAEDALERFLAERGPPPDREDLQDPSRDVVAALRELGY